MSECLLIFITGLFLFRGTCGTGDRQAWQRDIARDSNAYGVGGRLSDDRPLREDGRQRLLPLGFASVGNERRLEVGPYGGGSAGGVAPGGGGQPLGPAAPVVGRSPKSLSHAARGLAPDPATEEISLRLTVVTPRSERPASGDRQDGRDPVTSDGLTQRPAEGDILGAQQPGRNPGAAGGGQEIVLGFERNSAKAGGEEGETDIAPKQSKASSAAVQPGPPLRSDQAAEGSREGGAVAGPGHPVGVTSERSAGLGAPRVAGRAAVPVQRGPPATNGASQPGPPRLSIAEVLNIRPAQPHGLAGLPPQPDPPERDSQPAVASIDHESRPSVGQGRPIETPQGLSDVSAGPGATSGPGTPGATQQQREGESPHMSGTEWLPESIPGQPHVDYPVLINLPDSGFDCRSQEMDGFYADTSDKSRCQAFWVCHNKQQDGFLCPNGTVFNQRYLACDWWFNVQCNESPQYFGLNRDISVVGTHISAQPAGVPAAAASRVHPVLTMLSDMLKYPGVPPVPPSNSTAPSNKSAPAAPASQAATPSSSQQSYDLELDVANMYVVGGIPGVPQLDTKCSDHLQSETTDHTACSLNRLTTKGPKLTNKRHVKQSAVYIHKKPYKRDLDNKKTMKHLRRRKARDGFMVQAAKGLESATSMLSSRIPQVEQSAISQLRKRATSPSPGPAALPSAQAIPPDQGAAANQAGPRPIVQTVDKIAFPLAPNGGNLPKVEEDFKIQGMGGDGRATSIKDVMPSHFPVPGAVKVMAASGKEVPHGSMVSAPPSQTANQQSPSGPAPTSQGSGSDRDYASISLGQDVDFGQSGKAALPAPDQSPPQMPEQHGGSGEGAAEDGVGNGGSGSPNGQTAVSGFLTNPVAAAAQPPAPGNAAGMNDGSSAQDAGALFPPRQFQAGSPGQSKQGGPGESVAIPTAGQSVTVPTNQNIVPDPPPSLPLQGPPGEAHPPGLSGGQLPMRPSQDLKDSEAKPIPTSGIAGSPAGEDDKNSMQSGPMPEEVIEETSNVKILLPYSSKTGNSDINNGNLAESFGMQSDTSSTYGQPLAEGQPSSGQMLSGHEHDAVLPSRNQPAKNTDINPAQLSSGEAQIGTSKARSATGNPYASSVSADDNPTGGVSQLADPNPTSQQTGSVPAGGAQFDSATGVVSNEGSSEIMKELDSSSQFVQGGGQETGSLASNIQVQEKKLGNKPAFSSLLDDPSALKKEMPSENFRVLQQPKRKPEQDGALIPGHKSVQIKSESVSRIIKNPSRHRSAINDPAGMDLPELLRPPSFASYLGMGGFSLDNSMLSYSPTPPPHPPISRVKGSIDMKSGSNMARAAGPPPSGAVADTPPSLDSRVSGAAGSQVGSAAPQDGDLSARVSETLSMVDTILGPPPFKSRRSYKPGNPRQPHRNAENMSFKSDSFESRSRKRSSEWEPLYSDLGINLSVLISGSSNNTPPSSTGASANAMASLGQPPSRQHLGQNKEHIYVVKPSVAQAPDNDDKSTFRVDLRPKERPSVPEPKLEERIEIKTSEENDTSDASYDYDVAKLPGWMRKASKHHHNNNYSQPHGEGERLETTVDIYENPSRSARGTDLVARTPHRKKRPAMSSRNFPRRHRSSKTRLLGAPNELEEVPGRELDRIAAGSASPRERRQVTLHRRLRFRKLTSNSAHQPGKL